MAAVIWWSVLKGSWFLFAFLLSQQEIGGSMSIISASFCSRSSMSTAMRIHLFLPSIVYPYVNKLSLSVRAPVVSFADLSFSIYLKHFLSFILTSGAIFLSFSAFASLSFISQWLNFILQYFQSFIVFGWDLLNDSLILRTYCSFFYIGLSGLFLLFSKARRKKISTTQLSFCLQVAANLWKHNGCMNHVSFLFLFFSYSLSSFQSSGKADGWLRLNFFNEHI